MYCLFSHAYIGITAQSSVCRKTATYATVTAISTCSVLVWKLFCSVSFILRFVPHSGMSRLVCSADFVSRCPRLGPRGCFLSEYRAGGESVAVPRVNRSCAHPSTPSTRLDKPQVPFFKTWVWPNLGSHPAYQLQWRVLNQYYYLAGVKTDLFWLTCSRSAGKWAALSYACASNHPTVLLFSPLPMPLDTSAWCVSAYDVMIVLVRCYRIKTCCKSAYSSWTRIMCLCKCH